jgi:hypothetical protein
MTTHHANFKDITGRRIGRWTVLAHTPTGKPGSTRWRCKCDCGRIKERVLYNALTTGRSLSCGCLRTDLLRGKEVEVRRENQAIDTFTPSDLAELESLLAESKQPVMDVAKQLTLKDRHLWRCISRCRTKGLRYKGQKPTDFYVKLALKDELALWLRG